MTAKWEDLSPSTKKKWTEDGSTREDWESTVRESERDCQACIQKSLEKAHDLVQQGVSIWAACRAPSNDLKKRLGGKATCKKISVQRLSHQYKIKHNLYKRR